MISRFVPNPNFENELKRSINMGQALGKVADMVAEQAKTNAPVDQGDYRDGIDSTYGLEGSEQIGRVNGKFWTSGLIEFGTSRTPTFAPIRRAVASLGLRMKGSR